MVNKNIFIFSYSIILFLVSVFPSIFSHLFVSSSSNVMIIGLVLGFFISFGIYHRWRHIDKIFYLIFTATILFEIMIIVNVTSSNPNPNLILGGVHLFLFFLFIFSKSIKSYLKNDPGFQ